MSRKTAYADMLEASAKLQRNVAMILEAKAAEAEKVRSWLVNHAVPCGGVHEMRGPAEAQPVYERMVEAIEGLARLNSGMAGVLRAALHRRPGECPDIVGKEGGVE